MNRREFLQCAALLVSGVAASRVGLALTAEQQHFMAGADYIAKPANFFTQAQRNAVAAIAETVIPRTETPGAIDAGVPKFIELMVAEWFNDSERGIFNDGLRRLMDDAQQRYGKAFDQLPERERLGILKALEAAASDSSWYGFGNIQRDFISDAPFICQFKELTVWGFFTSEVGGTQVLRYETMPMEFDGQRDLAPGESSWMATYP